MLTPEEIEAGSARLDNDKLTLVDVDKIVSAWRRLFTTLEQKYSYKFYDKLTALTDAGNELKQCAQIAAILTKMEEEEIGFPAAAVKGGRLGAQYAEKDEFTVYLLDAFAKIYPIPEEFSGIDPMNRYFANRRGGSGSVSTTRVFES